MELNGEWKRKAGRLTGDHVDFDGDVLSPGEGAGRGVASADAESGDGGRAACLRPMNGQSICKSGRNGSLTAIFVRSGRDAGGSRQKDQHTQTVHFRRLATCRWRTGEQMAMIPTCTAAPFILDVQITRFFHNQIR